MFSKVVCCWNIRKFLMHKTDHQWFGHLWWLNLWQIELIVWSLCQQYRTRPPSASMLIDQALTCWLPNSTFYLDISKNCYELKGKADCEMVKITFLHIILVIMAISPNFLKLLNEEQGKSWSDSTKEPADLDLFWIQSSMLFLAPEFLKFVWIHA